MLYASVVLDGSPAENPPVVLIHGSANSAQVWAIWQQQLVQRGWSSYALDLRGHGKSRRIDLSRTSMSDYVADVRSLVDQLARPPVLIGWSMGGLVAMMAARTCRVVACVGLEPSTPALRVDSSMPLRAGEFGAEEYGLTRARGAARRQMPDLSAEERAIALESLGPESRYARDERRAGILIESLPCPLLIVTGSADAGGGTRKRYDSLWLHAEQLRVECASHWGLVLSRRVLETVVPAVTQWVNSVAS